MTGGGEEFYGNLRPPSGSFPLSIDKTLMASAVSWRRVEVGDYLTERKTCSYFSLDLPLRKELAGTSLVTTQPNKSAMKGACE